MIWFSSLIGDTFGISDPLIGLTISSIPAILMLIAVAKRGNPDMTMSFATGTCIVKLSIVLGLPWLIETAAYVDPISISSSGAGCSASLVTLFILLTLLGVFLSRYIHPIFTGVVMMFLYVLFVIIALMFEYEHLKCPI
jgi:Ca2+/Na+ antiporter